MVINSDAKKSSIKNYVMIGKVVGPWVLAFIGLIIASVALGKVNSTDY
jgi:hypothetical protein